LCKLRTRGRRSLVLSGATPAEEFVLNLLLDCAHERMEHMAYVAPELRITRVGEIGGRSFYVVLRIGAKVLVTVYSR
jgi:hypothetical protein